MRACFPWTTAVPAVSTLVSGTVAVLLARKSHYLSDLDSRQGGPEWLYYGDTLRWRFPHYLGRRFLRRLALFGTLRRAWPALCLRIVFARTIQISRTLATPLGDRFGGDLLRARGSHAAHRIAQYVLGDPHQRMGR